MTQTEIIDLSLIGDNQCSDWIEYPNNIRGATGGFLGNIPVVCGGTNVFAEIQNSGCYGGGNLLANTKFIRSNRKS